MQGIDKNLAQQARVLGAMDEAAFEDKVVEARSSATKVYRRIIREVEVEQERAERRANASPLPDGMDYRIGDCRKVLIDIKATPFILTDPPYEEAADPLFDWTFGFAQDVLPPGGSLILFTGHHRLPRDFELARKYELPYWWLLSLRHDASRQVPGKYVVLWFVKDHRRNNEYILDVLTSEGRDKTEHEWGQGEAGIKALIEALTEPGELIVDPFAGSGLWGRIATSMGRRWIGCDIVEGGSTTVAA
jgi:hypothetical protein